MEYCQRCHHGLDVLSTFDIDELYKIMNNNNIKHHDGTITIYECQYHDSSTSLFGLNPHHCPFHTRDDVLKGINKEWISEWKIKEWKYTTTTTTRIRIHTREYNIHENSTTSFLLEELISFRYK